MMGDLHVSLADLNILRAGAAKADGVIHLAFGNDFSSADDVAQAVAEESAALATLGEELAGSERPFVTVSGTPWVPGRVSTETDPLPTDGPVGGRGRAAMTVLDLASQGVRSTAVRMPRTSLAEWPRSRARRRWSARIPACRALPDLYHAPSAPKPYRVTPGGAGGRSRRGTACANAAPSAGNRWSPRPWESPQACQPGRSSRRS